MTTPLPDWATQPTPVAPPPSKLPDWERELLERQGARFAPEPAPAGTGPILGRALLDVDGDVWQDRGNGLWQGVGVEPYIREEELKRDHGPVREVLLVGIPAASPASGTTGPPILGRALRESGTGTLWREAPEAGCDGEWWYAGGYGHAQRPEVEESAAERGNGPVREVLLVDPAVARVLAAARAWWDSLSLDGREHLRHASADGALKALAAAVDALGDTTEAEPSTTDPLPAGGSGWGRQRLAELVAEARRRGPVDDMPDQVEALLADWDIAVRQRDSFARRCAVRFKETQAARVELVEANRRWAADHAVVTAELAQVTAESDDLRRRLKATSDDCNEARNELAAAVTERETQVGIAGDVRRELREVTVERDRLERLNAADLETMARMRAEVATARRDAELWERAAGDMEARDRHTAADALDWAAGEWDRTAVGTNEWPTRDQLHEWAADIRAGTRPVPGTPEPAPDRPEQWITTDPVRNPRLPRREVDNA